MWTRSSRLAVVALVLAVAVAWATPARADKIDDLTRALMQDPSYKVRVQAALILGKINDKRAVPALIQALHDENETVRGVAATSLGRLGDKSAANALMQSSTNDSSDFVKAQARKALELVAGGGGGPSRAPPPRAGARFYVAIDILGRADPQWARLVKEALQRELQKLPAVTLTVADGTPSKALLSSRHLSGFIVDVNVQQLTAVPASGGQQIDCGLKAVVATFPEKSIKMMTQEGASLTAGSGPAEADSGKRDCLGAAAEAVRDDVGKFLRTQE
jgi:hypothetical protein